MPIYSCTEGCDKKFKTKSNLDQHLSDNHDIGVVWYPCDQPGCNEKFKRKGTRKNHLSDSHSIGVTWHSCTKPDCKEKFKRKGTMKTHLSNAHNIGVVWHPCNQLRCNEKFKHKSALNRHLADRHDIGVIWYPCKHPGCKKKFKQKSTLNGHLSNAHDIGVVWHPCDQEGCKKKFKRKGTLNGHLSEVHDIGVVWYLCVQEGCNEKFKRKSALKRHLSDAHDIGVVWHPCVQPGCNNKFKRKGSLKGHIQYVHDIGDKVCEYCLGNRFKLLFHDDVNAGKVKICRRCYRKATGYTSRAEEQMVDTFETSKLSPYIILKDKIISHDACKTRRRPDLLLSSGELHVNNECDEGQHRHYNPKCEWGRMDEIIDEFKTGKIVFVRWNPDNYKPPNREARRKTREERLGMLLDLNLEIAANPPPDPISVYYMFYNKDNPVITKRWRTYFVY